MEHDTMRRNMWNSASKAAIYFGLVSAVYLFLTQYLRQIQIPTFSAGLLGFMLWTAKFGGCIWLMMFFMRKFAAGNSSADNYSTFRFGMITSFLSALIFSAASFADVAYIHHDLYAEMIAETMQAYAKFLDSNTINALDNVMGKLPQITFFGNLTYCFLYGTVLSAILSRSIPSKDPFADFTSGSANKEE